MLARMIRLWNAETGADREWVSALWFPLEMALGF